MPKEPVNSYAFRFTVNALIVLLATKLALAVPGLAGIRLSWSLASYVQDAAIILLSAGVLALARRAGWRALGAVASAGHLLLVSFVTAASIAYTPLIPDILRDPVNIFSLDLAILPFSAEYCFRPAWLILVLGFFAALVVASLFFPKRLRPASRAVEALGTLHVFLFVVSLTRPTVSPIAYSILDEAPAIARRVHNAYGISRLEASKGLAPRPEFAGFYREPKAPLAVEPRYRRILVLVMESVTYQEFEGRFGDPDSAFSKQIRAHGISYSNYHGVDFESYTGLIALLNSVLVPYRAYVDDSPFRFVNARPNLARALRECGFATCFVSSYGPQQVRFVPDRADWDVILLKDTGKQSRFIRVDANKMETALEDLAVLEDLVELCRAHRQIFLFQEMVCGHVADWRERTGEEPLAYYDRFFTTLWSRLEKEGLLDDTLIAITSDHGLRAAPDDPESYHIPLVFLAPDLAPGKEGAFLSHLDFADLLGARLGEASAPNETPYLLTVGSTVSFIYGSLEKNGAYTFIDDHSLRVRTSEATSKVHDVQRVFEEYLGFFEERRRGSPPEATASRENLVLK